MMRRRMGRSVSALVGAIAMATMLLIGMQVAFASHGSVTLTGSNFEIDSDANLKVDHGDDPASIDWANVNEFRQVDTLSGSGDESFGEGTKENTGNPTITDGSIPPNKSDLKFFGLYQEGNTSTGFLNLFWSRVQDPTGTTNMDFELNKNKCQHVDDDNDAATPSYNDDNNPNAVDTAEAGSNCAGNGVTPRRSEGDILITYDLSNGGTVATISFRTWNANQTQWRSPQSLGTDGVGTINSSSILAGDSDNLGAHDPRTFGEAQVRMSRLISGQTGCVAFGSAYLKSRSSDAFNSALKDFVPPESVDITTCGSVNITKTDDAQPANALNGAVFTLYNDLAPTAASGQTSPGAEDTATSLKCTTAGTGTNAGKCSISNVPFGNYWVVETTTPSGYETAAPKPAVVSASTPTVSLSFVDLRQRGAILVTKLRKHAADGAGDHPQSGVDFTVNGVTKTTDSNGKACFDDLLFGDYTVHETTPSGYSGEADKTVTVNNKASCADDPYGGEKVTFHNTPLTDITVSVDSQVDGGTASTITCKASDNSTVASGSTDANGDGSASASDLEPDTYTCTLVVDP